MKLSWKLLPLAAVVALGVAVLMPGGVSSPVGVSANVDNFTLPNEMTSGSEIDGHVTFDPPNDGDITIEIIDAGDATNIELDLGDCNVDCNDDDSDDDIIDINDDDIDDLEFTLTAECDVETDITVRASEQGGGSEDETVTCVPVGNIVITKTATDDPNKNFTFEITGDNSCDEEFTLSSGESIDFDCDVPDTYTITETVPAGWALVGISCQDDNISSSDIVIDEDNASVEVNLDDDDQQLRCTFINDFLGTVTPGNVGGVTLTVSTNNPPCNLPVVVIATVRDANNQLLSGVTVTFSAPKGTFTITSGQTAAGVLSTLYTGPSTGSESITLTATAGSQSGTTVIQTNCAAASPTPTAIPPTATPGGGIQPPSTGDAGLRSTGGTSLYAIIGAVLAAATLAGVGSVVVVRRGS